MLADMHRLENAARLAMGHVDATVRPVVRKPSLAADTRLHLAAAGVAVLALAAILLF